MVFANIFAVLPFMFRRLQSHKSFKNYRQFTEPFGSKQNQLKREKKIAVKKNKNFFSV